MTRLRKWKNISALVAGACGGAGPILIYMGTDSGLAFLGSFFLLIFSVAVYFAAEDMVDGVLKKGDGEEL